MKLTVFYDGQFWIGVIEIIEKGKVKAGRYVFGASEPADPEILDFVYHILPNMINQLSQKVTVKSVKRKKINPKRMARQVAKEMKQKGIDTKAQQALKLEHEALKKEKKIFNRQERDKLKERKRLIARQKAKAKHRGK